MLSELVLYNFSSHSPATGQALINGYHIQVTLIAMLCLLLSCMQAQQGAGQQLGSTASGAGKKQSLEDWLDGF